MSIRPALLRVLVLGLLILFVLLARGHAQDFTPGIILKQGEVAPADGAFYPGQAAISLLEDYRDLAAAKQKVEILLTETRKKDQQIDKLQEAQQAATEAVLKADLIIDNHKLIEENQKIILQAYKDMLEQLRQTNNQLLKSLKEAHKETFWARVFSGISFLGFLASVFR